MNYMILAWYGLVVLLNLPRTSHSVAGRGVILGSLANGHRATLMPKVAIVATAPSPYQAELCDTLAQAGEFQIEVVYLVRKHADRLWDCPSMVHEHVYWTDGPPSQSAAIRAVDQADLVVLVWYAEPAARSLIAQRCRSGRPWVYWGKPPRLPWLELARANAGGAFRLRPCISSPPRSGAWVLGRSRRGDENSVAAEYIRICLTIRTWSGWPGRWVVLTVLRQAVFSSQAA